MARRQTLQGKRIAILATDGVEQIELTEPRNELERAGATVELIAPHGGSIQGMNHDQPADKLAVDKTIGAVQAIDYDGLLLPGGVANPDALRTDADCVQFVREFFKLAKPVAAICHGPWMLVEADVVHDRTVTSWPSLKTDLINAGAEWVDQACVCDQGLVTSRRPDDLPEFCRKAIEEFAEGPHVGQTV